MNPAQADLLARDPLPLRGKHVVVTGVSRRAGLGYTTACGPAASGAGVFCHRFAPHDASREQGAYDFEAVLAGVHARLADGAHLADDKRVADGARVAGPRADLTEPGVPEQVTAAGVREFGYLGGLICNQALAGADGAIPELIVEHLDRHWAVDARATILLAQAFADQHEEGRSASVVFLTVRAGARPGARASEVRGDEGGDRRVPRPSRISWPIAESGSAPSIRTPQDTRPGPVDTGQLTPGPVDTGQLTPGPVDTGYLTDDMWRAVEPMFPFGRFGQPDGAARLLAWLMTDEARWITGQVMHSEGGFGR